MQPLCKTLNCDSAWLPSWQKPFHGQSLRMTDHALLE
jgi:hypothetical protein